MITHRLANVHTDDYGLAVGAWPVKLRSSIEEPAGMPMPSLIMDALCQARRGRGRGAYLQSSKP